MGTGTARRGRKAKGDLAADAGRGPIHLTLPYPPSVNAMYRAFRGRQILSREGRAYKERTALLTAGARPFAGPVWVMLVAFRPRQIGDLDNSLKMVLDSLKGVAFHDDAQVKLILAHQQDDKDRPRVSVEVRPAPPEGIARLFGAIVNAKGGG